MERVNIKNFQSFYKRVEGNEGDKCKYPTRLDLYGCGCQHNCSYCYARSLLSFRGLWNPAQPVAANWIKMQRLIRRNIREGDVVRLGGMTDCFQPIEETRRLTYHAITELNRIGAHYLIVTKSDLVADDVYTDIMDKRLAHIQISVTSTDDKLAATYERATPPTKRIAAIEHLQCMGFDVALRLSPFIPQYIDFDILNNVQCKKIQVEFLRVNSWIRQWFAIDYSEYTLHHANYMHLPLKKKIAYLQQIKGFEQLSVCEDVTPHFDYWKQNVNANPDDCCNLSI